jgi:ABC-type transporter Mla MlaB component
VVVIEGPLRQTDITGLCNRLGQLIERGRPTTVVCDVAALTEPDLVTVDALARMQLTAVRLGSRLRLCGAGSELQAFLALVGLSDVLPLRPDSRLQVVGQPEQREQGRGVQERVERGDPAS